MSKHFNKKDLVYAFIDSQNLNLGIRAMGWNLDFGRFHVYLREKFGVTKAFIFIGHVPENEDLYDKLREYGYTVIFKPTLEHSKNKKTVVKGNVDAELVLHTMIESPNYNKAIIVSGDGDFHCLIEYLSMQDKLGRILVPNYKYSSLLRKYAKYIVQISNSRKKLERI